MLASNQRACEFERRAATRHDKLASLERWLEFSRRKTGQQALALSDDQGCLIAGAGSARLCDELAALGPASLVMVPAAVKTNSLALGRGQAYLCAPAGLLEQTSLAHVAEGCSRILGL